MSQGIPSSKKRSPSALHAKVRHLGRVASPSQTRIVGGRYRVIKRAGEGLTARVYVAEDMQIAESVMVKQLTAEAAEDRPSQLASCMKCMPLQQSTTPTWFESSTTARLLTNSLFWLWKRFQAKRSVNCCAGKAVSSSNSPCIYRSKPQLGLSPCIVAETVHRDIKPDNLFLVGPPGKPTGLKIIDFGMAQLPDNRHAIGGGARFVVGTLQYMPPEQVLADPVDARADVYSLGIVMFRLFTGHLPFDVDAGLDMLGHQLLSPLPPIGWLNETVDPRLESIIVRATRKRPLNRYQIDGCVAERSREYWQHLDRRGARDRQDIWRNLMNTCRCQPGHRKLPMVSLCVSGEPRCRRHPTPKKNPNRQYRSILRENANLAEAVPPREFFGPCGGYLFCLGRFEPQH